MKKYPNSLPFKLNAKMDGDKVIMGKDDFEYILLCLCNQKFVGEPPQCGDAMAMSKKAYDKSQNEMQETIDNVYDQCMNFLHNSKTINKRQAAYIKKNGFGG
jgi:hypothetical protein